MSESTPAPTPTKARAPRKPKDHAPKAEELHEQQLEQEDLLADMPKLRPPHRLRLRHRNPLLDILLDSGLMDDVDEDDEAEEDEELDFSNPEHRAKIKDFMRTAAAVDDWAESIAEDPVAYAAWAEEHSDSPDVFLAILAIYANASGKSNGSAS